MKSSLARMTLLLCLFVACQKNTSNPTSPNNGNGGNNNNPGGGNSDSISVTSFSPANPYTADMVTITGSGFNPDKTKDSVWFHNDYGQGYFKISSATNTQLQVLLPPDSVSQILTAGSNGIVDLKLSANGKVKSLPTAIRFKMTLSLRGAKGPRNFGDPPRPGDSLYLFGRGFTWNSTAISINNQSMPIWKLDSAGPTTDGEYSVQWFAYTYLPKSFFGEINNEDSVEYLPCGVTNGDGKSAQALVPFGLSPLMAVTDMHYENEYTAGGGVRTISLSAASGAVLRLHVIGKNLKNDVDVALTGTDGSDTHSALPVAGFPDSTVVEFGTTNFKAGYTYVVTLRANHSSVGNAVIALHTIFVQN